MSIVDKRIRLRNEKASRKKNDLTRPTKRASTFIKGVIHTSVFLFFFLEIKMRSNKQHPRKTTYEILIYAEERRSKNEKPENVHGNKWDFTLALFTY